jgi:hypothetical protein
MYCELTLIAAVSSLAYSFNSSSAASDCYAALLLLQAQYCVLHDAAAAMHIAQ